MAMMRAARLHEIGRPMSIDTIEIPTPRPTDVLVRVKAVGIVPNTEVQFEVHGNTARLVKVPAKRAGGRGAGVVARIRGTSDVKMSTDEILSLTRKSG